MDSPENLLRVALQYTCVKVHHDYYAIREAWSNDVGDLLYDIKKSRKQCRLSSCMCATGCRATSYCNYSYNKIDAQGRQKPTEISHLVNQMRQRKKKPYRPQERVPAYAECSVASGKRSFTRVQRASLIRISCVTRDCDIYQVCRSGRTCARTGSKTIDIEAMQAAIDIGRHG